MMLARGRLAFSSPPAQRQQQQQRLRLRPLAAGRRAAPAVRAAAAAGSGEQAPQPGEQQGQEQQSQEQQRQAPSVVFLQQQSDASESLVAFPISVPLLPFPVEEVMLPGSVKTLHLYESRYLALLEEALGAHRLIGHAVVEQGGGPVGQRAASSPGALAAGEGVVLLMCCLARILEVKRVQVGALVKIQAEGRVAVRSLSQAQPYLRGEVEPLLDDPLPPGAEAGVEAQVEQLAATMRDLQNLSQRFKRSNATAGLQHAMLWWERRPLMPSSSAPAPVGGGGGGGGGEAAGEDEQQQQKQQQQQEEDLADRAARLSFCSLQPLPESSPQEQLKLLRCCVNAMETQDTPKRLALAMAQQKEALALLAAKCALKSLQLS